MTARTRYLVISSVLVTFVGIGSGLVAYYSGLPAGAVAGQSGPEELRYVPYDAALVAYADVRHIMTSELRQRIRNIAPGQDGRQHEFEDLTGINIETDIDHVVASLQADSAGGNGRGAGLVLARGTFNQVRIESLMRDHGAQVETYKDKRLIVAPARTPSTDPSAPPAATAPRQEMALAFLEPGLVAVGSSTLIRRAIDLENGGASVTTNEEIASQIRAIESADVWALGRFDALRATAQLPSGVGELPPITWFSGSGHVNDGVDGVVRAEASSDDAAKNLRDVVQGFVALANLQAGSRPELKALVESLQLSGTGRTVALSFSVPAGLVNLAAPPRTPGSQRQ
jgi:hypothetical protein